MMEAAENGERFSEARPRRRLWRQLGIGVLALLAIVFAFPGPRETVRGLYDLWQKGVFKGAEQKDYGGTNTQNLLALHKALMLYHDSEEKFPDASEWMDAIKPRLKTYVYGESALKKLVRPDLLPEKEGVYGYAINDACAGKYKDDIKGPDTTPLVFVSNDTSKNAHGDPTKLLPEPAMKGGNLGVSVSGKVLKLDGSVR